jgi:hypothetical protein
MDGWQVIGTSTCKSLCLIERLFLVKISFDIKNEYIYFYIKLTKGESMGFDLYGNNKGNSTGEYFRNNVWWWRRLADYVCEHTKVVNEKDFEKWQYNDGHQVSKEEAEQIANQLEHLISTGHTEKYAKKVQKEIKVAKTTNKNVDKLFEDLHRAVAVATGKELVPNEYPKVLKEQWDKIYKLRDSRENYPFNIQNVKEFIQFCRNSNGFRIS